MSEHPLIPDGEDIRTVFPKNPNWKPLQVTRSSALPTVTVEPGSNPNVLKKDGDPSGMGDMSPMQIDDICSLAKEEITKIVSTAPQTILDLSSPGNMHVPLYCGQSIEGGVTHVSGATNLGFVGNSPVGYAHPSLNGICINSNRLDNTESLRLIIGHETFHLLTLNGIHPHMRAPMECLVARLEKEQYGEERGGLTQERNWDPKRFVSSTGICPPDFTAIHYNSEAMDTLYLSSYFAADNLSADQTWKVWEELLTSANNTGFMPRFREIYHALMNIGDEGAKVLQTSSFQPMTQGRHQFAFPTKSKSGTGIGERIRFYTMQVQQNRNFGKKNDDGVIDDAIYSTVDAKGTYKHHVHNKSGSMMRHVEAGGDLRPMQELSYDEMADRMQQDKRSWRLIKSKLGNRMSFSLPGIAQQVFLEKENDRKDTTSTTLSVEQKRLENRKNRQAKKDKKKKRKGK